MTDLFKTLVESIIEAVVIFPIFIIAVIFFLCAIVLYPLKTIRFWFAKQAIRILDMWAYYNENRDRYFEVNDD